MFDSFRSRLVLSNLLITLMGLIVMVAVFANLLENHTRDVKLGERKAQAADISRQVERLYRTHASAAPQKSVRATPLQILVDTSSRILGARVIIVSPVTPRGGGVPIVDSAKKTLYFRGSWSLPDRKEIQRELASVHQLSRNSSLYEFTAPIHGTSGRNGGAVVLIVRVTQVTPGLSDLANVIAVGLATALVIWIIIGTFFTVTITRPLVRVIEATRRMAGGDYGARVDASEGGEMGRLATSFNSMAEQIQRSNQVLKDFVANVSHDLRTPLTIISGFSQALLDRAAEPDDAGTVIHEEAEKMERLVEDLLQLTRLESGLMHLDRRPIEPRAFLDGIAARVSHAAAGRRIPTLQVSVDDGLPALDADPVQLERALQNLIGNAVDYTPPSGTVTLAAQAADRGWVEISVSDTGSGIAPDDLPRVFERFYRSDRSRERGHGHSGLGLAIVREIVEAHGGQVAVESEPGQGTSFRLTVPAASERATPTRREVFAG
jgi:signal transduction histidine kinase